MFEFPGQYYELIRADLRAAEAEADFLAGLSPSAGHVLDVGCGTGTLLRALAERGFSGVGVDQSSSFIAYAQQAGDAARSAKTRYVAAPIGRFAAEAHFDLVVCVFATLNLLPPEELPGFFAAAYRWLRPGGLLVVEAAHLLNFVESYQPAMITRHSRGPTTVTRVVRNILTPHEALWRSEESVLVRSEGSPPEVYDNAFGQWVYTGPELRRELLRAGFRLTAEYGGYQGAPPTGRGPLVQVATRP